MTLQNHNDDCPSWADKMLRQIHDLEVKLGNIKDPEESWTGGDLSDLEERVFGGGDPDAELASAEATVEALFRRVATGLTAEGFEAPVIADFVNARVGKGGRLPYCNAKEVQEAVEGQLD